MCKVRARVRSGVRVRARISARATMSARVANLRAAPVAAWPRPVY